MRRSLLPALCLVLASSCVSPAIAAPAGRLVSVQKIWGGAPHNAFTDLVRHQGRWFCVFREGQAHVSPDGALRVITSTDGEAWESAALLTSPDSDLRDAKISVTPDGQLMLAGAEALHDRSRHSHQSLAWFSRDGRQWSEQAEIGDPNYWLWRVTWRGDAAYSIGYECGTEKSIRLYHSADGRRFETLVERLFDEGYPNETAIVFHDDTAYCLLRRDGQPASGLIGVARAPFTIWQWKELGVKIGGPAMLRWPDGRLIAAVRLYNRPVRTSLCVVDPVAGKLDEILKLPSGGDCSYAGLVEHEGLLWVSYYSSHEGKTSIYLAKVEVAPLAGPTEGTAGEARDQATFEDSVRDVGARRELFVDDFLIDRLDGAALKLHLPEPREVSLTCDAPWEGNTSAYYTLLADGDRYRMYYRGSHFDEVAKQGAHPEVTCLAESRDGIHWNKPSLGLHEFSGSTANNIVWAGDDTHNLTPFNDANPDAPPESRYKALGGSAVRWNGQGLRAYQSPDGLRWSRMREEGVLTDGDFDSQNLAFWHPERKCYVAFYRKFRDGVRDIMTATSTDFLHWSEPRFLDFGDAPREHLYTNAVALYPRAPQLYLGFPTRFQPKHEQVEPVLMTSRDGLRFRRWPQPLIPITAPQDRDGNRSNYMTHGLLQLPGDERHVSVYATEAYYTGPGSRVRRFTFRADGFVSVHADERAGELRTRPLLFAGDELALNYRAAPVEGTLPGGSLRVEIQDVRGRVLPGFALADCEPLSGDEIDQPVRWQGNACLAQLAGQPIRLRVVLESADLFALRFRRGG